MFQDLIQTLSHWARVTGPEFSIRWHESLPPDYFVHFLQHGGNFWWCFIYMSVSDDTYPSRHQHSISEQATLSHHQRIRTNNDTEDAKWSRKHVGTGRQGTRGAESSTTEFIRNRKKETLGLSWKLETPKPTPNGMLFSNKSTPLNSCQVAPLPNDILKYMNLWGLFLFELPQASSWQGRIVKNNLHYQLK